jgi:dGTPase
LGSTLRADSAALADNPANRIDRYHPETKPEDFREPAQHDYDRIVYASAFRRLAGVTQVVSASEGHVFHNRLTHSLQVARLARRLAQKVLRETPDIAESLGGISADVTEAAALAHDLGHPPFGHIAEEELNDLVTGQDNLDGFEGNAQSFRIVTKLALRTPDPDLPGLNLTRATLNALLKYPRIRQPGGKERDKWGAYYTEKDELKFARALHPPEDERKGAEAELMDWA